MNNRYASYDEYSFRHLPSHLIMAERWDVLKELLRDPEFVAPRFAAGSEMVYQLLTEYYATLYETSEIPPFLRRSSYRKVFISYAKEDYEIAKKLYDDLKRYSYISTWLDTEAILPGQNWKVTISQAIEDSSYFLALLSSKSLSKKGFVQKELKIALDILDEFPLSKTFIIPIRLEQCELIADKRLQELHWVDLFTNYEKGLGKILQVLIQDS